MAKTFNHLSLDETLTELLHDNVITYETFQTLSIKIDLERTAQEAYKENADEWHHQYELMEEQSGNAIATIDLIMNRLIELFPGKSGKSVKKDVASIIEETGNTAELIDEDLLLLLKRR